MGVNSQLRKAYPDSDIPFAVVPLAEAPAAALLTLFKANNIIRLSRRRKKAGTGSEIVGRIA